MRTLKLISKGASYKASNAAILLLLLIFINFYIKYENKCFRKIPTFNIGHKGYSIKDSLEKHINVNNLNSEFVLFRMLGNDIPTRHSLSQTLTNLQYILENEPELPELDKIWILHKIIDKSQEQAILSKLTEYNKSFVRIPYNANEHKEADFMYQYSTIYYNKTVMSSNRGPEYIGLYLYPKMQIVANINRARNFMIQLGQLTGADYILPWDGNCFLDRYAWTAIRNSIYSSKYNKSISKLYYLVHLRRVTDNSAISIPEKTYFLENDEPQIIVHRKSNARFNESMPYGFLNKVEMLWRLGVPGPWSSYARGLGPWKITKIVRPKDLQKNEKVVFVGYTYRLSSGKKEMDDRRNGLMRARARMNGLEILIAKETYYTWPFRTVLAFNSPFFLKFQYFHWFYEKEFPDMKSSKFLIISYSTRFLSAKSKISYTEVFYALFMLDRFKQNSARLLKDDLYEFDRNIKSLLGKFEQSYFNCKLWKKCLLSDLFILVFSSYSKNLKLFLRHISIVKYRALHYDDSTEFQYETRDLEIFVWVMLEAVFKSVEYEIPKKSISLSDTSFVSRVLHEYFMKNGCLLNEASHIRVYAKHELCLYTRTWAQYSSYSSGINKCCKLFLRLRSRKYLYS